MVDLISSLMHLWFAAADGAAAPTTPAALVPNGVPDTADVSAIVMPKGGAVVALGLMGAPASGDTVTAQVYHNGTAVAGCTATITNAAPNATAIFSKDTAAQQFVSGDTLTVKYTTTTSGTYTAKDLLCFVGCQMGLAE